MPQKENLGMVRGFVDKVLNGGDTASLEGFSHQDVAVPQSGTGIDVLRRLLLDLRGTFADPEFKVLDTTCEGEKVVVRFSAKATHAGRFLGVPPTGRPLNLWGVMIFRFEAGAIAEFWFLFDAQAVLKQLRGP